MRHRLLVPLLTLPLLLTACAEPEPASSRTPSGTGSTTAAPTPTTATTPAPTGSVGSGAGPTATAAPGGGSTAAPVKNCGAPNLKYSLYTTDAGAGNITYTIAGTNRGSTTCRVLGAPRLYFVGEDGKQLGAEAAGGGEYDFISIPPGESAYNDLVAVNVGTGGGPLGDSCTPKKAVAIAVEAPNYDTSARLAFSGYGCTEPGVQYLTVSSVRR